MTQSQTGPAAKMALSRRFRTLFRREEGVTAVEFAMVLPVLIFLLMGGVEVASYVLLHNKLSRVASTTADITTRTPTVTEADLAQILSASATIALPYKVDQEGAVVISSITADADTTAKPPIKVNWQRAKHGTAVSFSSEMGTEGDAAKLPAGFVLRPTQNVIAVEVFFDYEPMFFGWVTQARQIYHRSIIFPRAGALATIAPPPTTP